MSKHMMHCKTAEKVRYAGECHFQWADDVASECKVSEIDAPARSETEPKFWLVMDNNSGTMRGGGAVVVLCGGDWTHTCIDRQLRWSRCVSGREFAEFVACAHCYFCIMYVSREIKSIKYTYPRARTYIHNHIRTHKQPHTGTYAPSPAALPMLKRFVDPPDLPAPPRGAQSIPCTDALAAADAYEADDMPALCVDARVFQLNFPDLEVETIRHDDPRMSECVPVASPACVHGGNILTAEARGVGHCVTHV